MAEQNQVQVAKPMSATQIAITDFNKKINGNYVQTQLKSALKENAGTFSTSLIEVFTNDKQLQSCDVNKVVQEAIKAASMKLPINKNLGYAYLLVFNNWDKEKRVSVPTPQLVIGYKGLLQLAYRTGYYTDLNADIVYEGELTGRDKLSGRIDISGEKISDKVEGYFAYFELKSGIRKTLYMSVEEMANYALRFAPTFKGKNPPKVDELIDAAQEQAQNGVVAGQVGWKGDFNGMAVKTCLRRLLSKYGYLSIEMMDAMAKDEQPQFTQAEAIRDEENHEARPVVNAANAFDKAEEVKAEEVAEQTDDKPDF
jgi:recombination protein RecT